MPAATDDATEAASAARVETAPTCTNAAGFRHVTTENWPGAAQYVAVFER